jgi:TonB family protein
MKRLSLLLLLCLLGCWNAFAQDVTPSINASSCEKPDYPVASKRLTEEGTVHLRFLVGVDGKIVESAIEKSSGFRRLDEAAIQGLSKCAFKPRTKDGVAVESWASMKYTWRIDVSGPCVGSDVTKWRSCLGTLPTPNGGLSVIEYEAGKKKGRGIEYDKSGNVIRAGIFEGENLVSERTLDIKLYPFIAQLPANSADQTVNAVVIQPDVSTSNLPVCPPSGFFQNCFGTYIYPNSWSRVQATAFGHAHSLRPGQTSGVSHVLTMASSSAGRSPFWQILTLGRGLVTVEDG